MYSVKEIFYTLQGEGAQTGRAAVFCRFAGCNLWSGREEDRAAAVCRFCDTDFVGTAGQSGGKFASAEELAEAIAACWPLGKATAPDVSGGLSVELSQVPKCEGPGAPSVVAGSEKTTAGPSTPVAAATSAQDDSGFNVDVSGLSKVDDSGGQKFVVCTGGEPLLQLDVALIEALHARGFEIAVETNGTCAAPAGLDWVCVSPKAGADLKQTSGDELKLVFPQQGIEPEQFAGLSFRYFFLQPMDGPDRERNTELAVHYCLEHTRWRVSLQTHKLLGIA